MYDVFTIYLMIMKVKGRLTTLLSGSVWEQLTVGLTVERLK